jgi:hypothetical protein
MAKRADALTGIAEAANENNASVERTTRADLLTPLATPP